MNNKPVGGRGYKAPYKTKTIRIPIEIEPQVEELTDKYRQAIIESESNTVDVSNLLNSTDSSEQVSKDEAIEQAHKILKGRKSARVSLEKLLQVLYDDKNIKL